MTFKYNCAGDAVKLLIHIRRSCCDGRTNIPIDDHNRLLINHLVKNDLIVSRVSKAGPVNDYVLCYYTGVTPKGRELCKMVGIY